MDHLTLGKIVLATPWLIYLSVCDFRKRQLPNPWVFGGILVMLAVAFGAGTSYALMSLATAFLSALFLLLPFFLRAAGARTARCCLPPGSSRVRETR